MISKQRRVMEVEMLKRTGGAEGFRVILERLGLTPFRHADGKSKIINDEEYDTVV